MFQVYVPTPMPPTRPQRYSLAMARRFSARAFGLTEQTRDLLSQSQSRWSAVSNESALFPAVACFRMCDGPGWCGTLVGSSLSACWVLTGSGRWTTCSACKAASAAQGREARSTLGRARAGAR
eukprot:7938583-Pyramimonas_sp.AAC.1